MSTPESTAESTAEFLAFLTLFPTFVLQIITYVMCIIRWFITDHYAFWHGFKELIWIIIPVVNFAYVWDWWIGGLALLLSYPKLIVVIVVGLTIVVFMGFIAWVASR